MGDGDLLKVPVAARIRAHQAEGLQALHRLAPARQLEKQNTHASH